MLEAKFPKSVVGESCNGRSNRELKIALDLFLAQLNLCCF